MQMFLRPKPRLASGSTMMVLFLLVWLLAWLLPLAGYAFAFQPSTSTGQSSRTLLESKSQNEQDRTLMEWYSRHGILGACDQVEVKTTPESVAGRGLFAKEGHQFQQGDMLALIPAERVFSTANPKVKQLQAQLKLQDENHNNNKEARHAILAACAFQAKKLENGDNSHWSQWIDTWQGPPCIRPLETFSNSELQELSNMAETNLAVIQDAIETRYNVYQNDHSIMANACGDTNVPLLNELYTIILSRSANLGPDWEYQGGIIPLHDMLNHPPRGVAPSVELMSIGEVTRLTSEAFTKDLVQSAFGNNLVLREMRDLVLVARRPIQGGEELLMSYSGKADTQPSEKERAWRMLQYGFPLSQ